MTGRAVAAVTAALLALPAAPAYADRATTEASLNVYVRNPAPLVRADVAAAMRRATVIRLQEVSYRPQLAGLRAALAAHPHWRASWRLSRPGRLGPMMDAIAWKTTVWQGVAPARYRRVHDGIPAVTPPRFITWKALRLRATGQVVTIANTHVVAGWCSRPKPPVARRTQLAAQHFEALADWTRQQQAAHPKRPILLGGDLNCQTTEPTVRKPLGALYRLGSGSPGVDHLLTARGPHRPATARVWRVPAHSDHDLLLRTVRWQR